MQQLNKDNAYPVVLHSPADADPNTTLVFNQEQLDERLRQGWKTDFQPRDYPKHIRTGKTQKVVSPWDGQESQYPLSVIVANEIEEKALLASLREPEEVKEISEPVRRGPGRPPKAEETVTA